MTELACPFAVHAGWLLRCATARSRAIRTGDGIDVEAFYAAERVACSAEAVADRAARNIAHALAVAGACEVGRRRGREQLRREQREADAEWEWMG